MLSSMQQNRLASAHGGDGWTIDINNITNYKSFQVLTKRMDAIYVSIVGAHDAGKSWLMNLIFGFAGASSFEDITNGLSVNQVLGEQGCDRHCWA